LIEFSIFIKFEHNILPYVYSVSILMNQINSFELYEIDLEGLSLRRLFCPFFQMQQLQMLSI
jgi:hypothetical protein